MKWTWALGVLGLAMIVAWPWVREFEGKAWELYYIECAERHAFNVKLLNSEFCDEAHIELKGKEKVDCTAAREENNWGIWACTFTKRTGNHTIVIFVMHLWQSWYVFGVVLVVVYLSIKGCWKHRTEVATKQLWMKTQSDLLKDVLKTVPSQPSLRELEDRYGEEPSHHHQRRKSLPAPSKERKHPKTITSQPSFELMPNGTVKYIGQ